jgi:NDP-sugar pyrophosphorylase family protein
MNRIKKAVILSAGSGTRMGSLTNHTPKVMLKLAGKPLLQCHIELMKKHGVSEICINLHYLSEKIKTFLGNGRKFGVKIHYSYEPELLGTAGALRAFKDILTEDFFIIYGDVIGVVDVDQWVEFHKTKNADATLIIHRSVHPEDSDIIQIDRDSRIIDFFHKPGHSAFGIMTVAAWHIMTPKVFNCLPPGNSDLVKDVFPKMQRSGLRLYGYHTEEFLMDAGTPERFKEIESHFLR